MRDLVLDTIRRHALLPAGCRVGVAVSGGPDSVCLLHLLLALRDTLELELIVLHFDHKLRGLDSTEDAEFVQHLAHRHGLDFHLECADIARLAEGHNIEQAAREARRDFFVRMITSGIADRVATGHTLSDQAETVLFRLLRGAGTTGLSGILPRTSEGIVRPLILVRRDQVMDYLHDDGIPFRTDRTNQDRSLSRNRIRLDLIPTLRTAFNPSIEEQLAQAADLARAEEAYWHDETVRHAAGGFVRKSGAIVISCPWLLAQPLALARRLIRHAIHEVKGDLRQIGFGHVEQVLELARFSEGHGRRQFPGIDVFRSFDSLRFDVQGADAHAPRIVSSVLRIPGVTRIGPTCVVTSLLQGSDWNCGYNEGEDSGAGFSFLDWDRLHQPLTMRFWLPGDQYRPVGAAGPEKLKHLFQSRKVPLWERRFWPIIENGKEIVWSRGFGPAAGLQASRSSGQVLKIGEFVDGE
ncbi:MAG: tRNA lysidine(34) synthetase TilS [Bryobacterales bacterium]|nr:tRNA lysidine(34) synthetase TilS [Bryobacterales bacterium]